MLLKRIKSDSGLMGPTHALSSIAIALLLTWLASDFMLGTVLGSDSAIVFIAALIIIVGASLMPDLDAVQSTSINTLGIVGSILSKAMRGFSSIVQSVIRSSSDAVDADPHRGFWHTIIAAILMGFLTFTLTNIDVTLFTISGVEVSVALFVIIFIIFISIQLLIASLFKSIHKKTKGNLSGKILIRLGSLFVATVLVVMLPEGLDYKWVGAAVAFGWIAHLLGDMMTVSGVPILFPLKFKGKRWWNFRFPLGIKAGGWFEKAILMPLFGAIAIISAIFIIPILS